MNVDQLLACSSVLGEMATNFHALPTEDTHAKEAGFYCQIVQNYVLEFAKHLVDGMEPYDAAVATAAGELQLSTGASMVLSILAAKPNQ